MSGDPKNVGVESGSGQQAGQPRKRRRIVDRLFSPWMKEYTDVSYDWQQDAHKAFADQQPLRARALLYGIAFVFIFIVIWSAIAQVNEVTRGQGKVIPSRKIQIIQSQDGGTVLEILVREGDSVTEGQLLVSLDQTRSQSSFRESMSEFQALTVKANRLRALVEKTDFEPDPDMREAVPRIVAQEVALYNASKSELSLEKQIAEQQLIQVREELTEVTARERQLSRSQDLTQRELNVTRPMVASGAVSQVEILRLEREVNKLNGETAQAVAQMSRFRAAISEAQRKVEEVELVFVGKVREELADTLTRLNALTEVSAGLSHRVDQNAVRSPVNGTVKTLHFNTIGGVVLPGKEIIEIVPSDDTLLLEVNIHPRDIAFLVPGQGALVKFSAYDFVIYGGLDGKVEQIGADTQMDPEGKPYYLVSVRTKDASLGLDMPIIPGMTVEVDILTGKKSILAYLMKPVLRAKQVALTER